MSAGAGAGAGAGDDGQATLAVPKVCINASGWGPTATPTAYQHVPYAAFAKGEKIGRVADITGFTKNWHRNRYHRDVEGNTEFAYRHDEQDGDGEFKTVDTVKGPRRHDFRRRPQRARRRPTPREDPRQTARAKKAQMPGSFNKRYDRLNKARLASRRRYWEQTQIQRDASVKVEADWEVLEQIDLTDLNKVTATPPKAEDIKWAGNLDRYDDAYDRVSARSEVKLRRFEDKEFFYVSAHEDPELSELAQEGAGNVFATDQLMAALMAAPRSVYPWDIIINVVGTLIFLDVRDGVQAECVTVGETSHDPPGEDPRDPNSRHGLSLEATSILQNFTQQVLMKNRVVASGAPKTVAEEKKTVGGEELDEHPFFDEEDSDFQAPASMCYRYRKWKLDDNTTFVARCHLNGYSHKKKRDQLMTIFALNEYNPRLTGWRKKIDAQRGAVIATELKNNAAKLAKWTAQSVLAGADIMKIGYVTRGHAADHHNHVILGTQLYKPREFAHQVSLEPNKMWGIMKWVVDLARKHAKKLRGETPEDAYIAKFLLLKDPNRPLLRLYSVPNNAFESEDEDEDWAEGGVAESKN